MNVNFETNFARIVTRNVNIIIYFTFLFLVIWCKLYKVKKIQINYDKWIKKGNGEWCLLTEETNIP